MVYNNTVVFLMTKESRMNKAEVDALLLAVSRLGRQQLMIEEDNNTTDESDDEGEHFRH